MGTVLKLSGFLKDTFRKIGHSNTSKPENASRKWERGKLKYLKYVGCFQKWVFCDPRDKLEGP